MNWIEKVLYGVVYLVSLYITTVVYLVVLIVTSPRCLMAISWAIIAATLVWAAW